MARWITKTHSMLLIIVGNRSFIPYEDLNQAYAQMSEI